MTELTNPDLYANPETFHIDDMQYVIDRQWADALIDAGLMTWRNQLEGSYEEPSLELAAGPWPLDMVIWLMKHADFDSQVDG